MILLAVGPTIPEFITVHLGAPDSNAQNVTVPFIDYIKNVASSEIYPNWPESSLRANIYAQISFALNKIYTEFYRSRGYNFDITNTTQFDQAFVPGRNIFGDINRIVDEIFDSYLRREGFLEPLAAAFCNGTTVTCEGLSQWGTVSLANQGFLPFEIIRYYYGDDVNIITDVPVDTRLESYPGTPIRLGDTGSVVRRIQNSLNIISTNYPLIPKITPDGVFGESTEEAVRTFQRIFNLTPDGVVGRATWYRIVSLVVGINRLNELDSIGNTLFGLSLEYPDAISEGNTGEKVSIMQLMLNILSEYYNEIPPVPNSGSFESQTLNGVLAFQKLAGVPETGVVDDRTWELMYNAVKGIYISEGKNTSNPPVEILPYPGTILSAGSQGSDVLALQEYLNEISLVYTTITPVIPNGDFGTTTRDAVLAFQREFNLAETGEVDRATWEEITKIFAEIRQGALPAFGQYPGYELKEGQVDRVRGIETDTSNLTGRPVYSIQHMLRQVRSDKELPGIPDGIFGRQTTQRVKEFQTENNIESTGAVDSNTFSAIRDAYNSVRDQDRNRNTSSETD
ncbi:MAG: peptidoglycan-binding protein [Clostridia bacterium]|nr:peptidoglycan-binding protein [Clostridia bacterium]